MYVFTVNVVMIVPLFNSSFRWLVLILDTLSSSESNKGPHGPQCHGWESVGEPRFRNLNCISGYFNKTRGLRDSVLYELTVVTDCVYSSTRYSWTEDPFLDVVSNSAPSLHGTRWSEDILEALESGFT